MFARIGSRSPRQPESVLTHRAISVEQDVSTFPPLYFTEVQPVLVLSRKETQILHLGDSITIKVVGISGDQVRLGIEAPREIRVLRDELTAHDEPTA